MLVKISHNRYYRRTPVVFNAVDMSLDRSVPHIPPTTLIGRICVDFAVACQRTHRTPLQRSASQVCHYYKCETNPIKM
jgi:hypothetical protein